MSCFFAEIVGQQNNFCEGYFSIDIKYSSCEERIIVIKRTNVKKPIVNLGAIFAVQAFSGK